MSLTTKGICGVLLLCGVREGNAANLEVGRGVHVSATVNNEGPFQFCVDTGLTDRIVVSEELASRLNLAPIGQVSLGDPSGKAAISVKTVRLDSISIDSTTLTNVVSPIQPALAGPQDCQGVIGLPFFAGSLVTLDLPNRKLTIAPGELKAGEKGVLGYTMDGGLPSVDLRSGNHIFSALVDSMGPGLSIPAPLASQLHFSSPLRVVGMGRTVSGSFEIKGGVLADSLWLGSYNFQGSFIEVNSHFPTAGLGIAALRHFAITFDQRAKLVRFVSADTHIVIEPPQMRPRSPDTL
jgi:hypothetical protein